jgi:hypothetical protein
MHQNKMRLKCQMLRSQMREQASSLPTPRRVRCRQILILHQTLAIALPKASRKCGIRWGGGAACRTSSAGAVRTSWMIKRSSALTAALGYHRHLGFLLRLDGSHLYVLNALRETAGRQFEGMLVRPLEGMAVRRRDTVARRRGTGWYSARGLVQSRLHMAGTQLAIVRPLNERWGRRGWRAARKRPCASSLGKYNP